MPPSTARPYVLLVCSTLLASCGYVPVLYDPKADGSPWSGADAGGAVTGDAAPAGGADPQAADGPPPAEGAEPADASPPADAYATTDASGPTDAAPSPDAAVPADSAGPACGNTCNAQQRDGCCPAGCNASTDLDCAPRCGNGVKEGSETCDPLSSCPTTCPAQGCQLRKLVNAGTCAAACADDRRQTTCATGDGCCPPACNASNDGECAPACGNGVVERGETCEPVAECMRRQAACTSDQNTLRTGRGSATACTFECQQSPRPCGPADGACPSGCGADPNCLPRPESCTHIQFCINPIAPNLNQVICITNDDARCTDAERLAECAREATTVCGANHARPVIFRPPIGGRPSG